MSDFYDRQGKKIKMMEWAKQMDDIKYRRVKWTRLWWGGYVSTVWLGLDHNAGQGNRPRATFETMAFTFFAGTIDCVRCGTTEQAERFHDEVVREWSSPIYIMSHLFEIFVLDFRAWRTVRRIKRARRERGVRR